MMNHVPDPFYKSEEEKENAAKKAWYLYLLLLPETTDFNLADIFRDYSIANPHIVPESIFQMTNNIENILRSKELITFGDTGGLMTKITEKGKQLKEGALKHKILSFLFDNSEQTFFWKILSQSLSIELSIIDYLTEEMANDNAIIKTDCSSKQGHDFFIGIAAKGKGIFLKEEYLNLQAGNKNLVKFEQHIKEQHIGDRNTTNGDNSPIVGRDFINEIKQKEDTISKLDMDLKKADLELKKLEVHYKKYKWIYGIAGAIGGAIITLITSYLAKHFN